MALEMNPEIRARWTGLRDHDPLLDPHHPVAGEASQLNDDGYTFAEIADLIDGGAS